MEIGNSPHFYHPVLKPTGHPASTKHRVSQGVPGASLLDVWKAKEHQFGGEISNWQSLMKGRSEQTVMK